MRCNEVQPLLSPFYDGELLPEQVQDVAAHVETCPSCAGRLRSMQRLTAEFASEHRTVTGYCQAAGGKPAYPGPSSGCLGSSQRRLGHCHRADRADALETAQPRPNG
jgi:hypothetical protein